MYTKNLTEDLRLRLSKVDMDFLKTLSEERSQSVSEVIRSIIGDYRRSLDMLSVLKDAFSSVSKNIDQKEVQLSHGDTKTDFIDKL